MEEYKERESLIKFSDWLEHAQKILELGEKMCNGFSLMDDKNIVLEERTKIYLGMAITAGMIDAFRKGEKESFESQNNDQWPWTKDVKSILCNFGLYKIAQERKDHFEKHCHLDEHDDKHMGGELLKAAIYCINPDAFNDQWPWTIDSVDRNTRDHIQEKNEIDRLAVAGSFIAAEIDRLKRTILDNTKTDPA